MPLFKETLLPRAVPSDAPFLPPSFCVLRRSRQAWISLDQRATAMQPEEAPKGSPSRSRAPRKRNSHQRRSLPSCSLRAPFFFPVFHRAPLHRTAEAREWDRVERIELESIDRDDGRDMNWAFEMLSFLIWLCFSSHFFSLFPLKGKFSLFRLSTTHARLRSHHADQQPLPPRRFRGAALP